jgi:hypothetical protein
LYSGQDLRSLYYLLGACKDEYASLGKHLGVEDSHLKAMQKISSQNFLHNQFLCLEVLLHDYMNHNPQAETLYAVVEQLETKGHTFKTLLGKHPSCSVPNKQTTSHHPHPVISLARTNLIEF